MFLRVTHAVSRRQEFVADELAARTIGAKPLADGLRLIHKVAPAFDYYWRSECAPVLHAGFLPPLTDGFSQFVTAGSIVEKMDKDLEEQLAGGKANPYDTHPPLKDRIAAVAGLPPGPDLAEDLPAVSLLQDVPALECDLILQVAGAEQVAKLKSIAWEEVGTKVYLPQWEKLVQLNNARLQGVTPEFLAKLAGNLKTFGKSLLNLSKETPDDWNAENFGGAVLGAALNLLLLQRGGQLDVAPGHEITVTLNEHPVQPFVLLAALKNGEITAEAWTRQCGELGIEGVDLGAVAPAAVQDPA